MCNGEQRKFNKLPKEQIGQSSTKIQLLRFFVTSLSFMKHLAAAHHAVWFAVGLLQQDQDLLERNRNSGICMHVLRSTVFDGKMHRRITEIVHQ